MLVLVVSSPRSGTTLVAKLLEHFLDARLVFEPFHPARNPWGNTTLPERMNGASTKDWDPSCLTFLEQAAEDFRNPSWLGNAWVNSRSSTTSFPRGNVVVKEIRCLAALGPLVQLLRPDHLVWVRRHPCGVLNSVRELPERDFDFSPWWLDETGNGVLVDWLLQGLPREREIVQRLLGAGGSEDPESRSERVLADWFLGNRAALLYHQSASASFSHVLHYEDLLVGPAQESAGLLHLLTGQDFPGLKDRAQAWWNELRTDGDPWSIHRSRVAGYRWRDLLEPIWHLRAAYWAELFQETLWE